MTKDLGRVKEHLREVTEEESDINVKNEMVVAEKKNILKGLEEVTQEKEQRRNQITWLVKSHAIGEAQEFYLMMAARRSYTNVVSRLFPQMGSQPKPTGPEIVNIEDNEDEIQVVEVVDGKKANELSSKNIKYDPLPSFKGFTRPPKRRKDEDSKEKENLKSEVKLQTKTKSRLSKMLKSREIYRKILEQKIKSNRRLEELIKDHGRKSENMNRKLKRKLAKLRGKAKEKGDEDLVKEISKTSDELMKEYSEKNKQILEELSKQGSES